MLGTQRACAEQARCHPSKLSVREAYGLRCMASAIIFDAFTMGGAVGLVPQPAADEAAVFAALAQAADQLTLVSELLVVPPPSALDGSTPLRVLFRRDPSAPGTSRRLLAAMALGILAVGLVALWMRHWLASAERRHRSGRLKGDPKHMRLGQLEPDLDPDLDEHFEPDVLEDALDDDDFLAQLTKDPSQPFQLTSSDESS